MINTIDLYQSKKYTFIKLHNKNVKLLRILNTLEEENILSQNVFYRIPRETDSNILKECGFNYYEPVYDSDVKAQLNIERMDIWLLENKEIKAVKILTKYSLESIGYFFEKEEDLFYFRLACG